MDEELAIRHPENQGRATRERDRFSFDGDGLVLHRCEERPRKEDNEGIDE